VYSIKDENIIYLLDLKLSKVVQTKEKAFNDKDDLVGFVDFSHDGVWIIASSVKGWIKIWETDSFK
jgi:hypothetical protein